MSWTVSTSSLLARSWGDEQADKANRQAVVRRMLNVFMAIFPSGFSERTASRSLTVSTDGEGYLRLSAFNHCDRIKEAIRKSYGSIWARSPAMSQNAQARL